MISGAMKKKRSKKFRYISFKKDQNKKIQYDAVDLSIKPCNVVRKIGLQYQHIQRPRIGLSFDPGDLAFLAERYNLAPDDDKQIKGCVMAEVNLYYDKKNKGND
jgi:hypothetical protein